jgi:hypothetical protein
MFLLLYNVSYEENHQIIYVIVGSILICLKKFVFIATKLDLIYFWSTSKLWSLIGWEGEEVKYGHVKVNNSFANSDSIIVIQTPPFTAFFWMSTSS